LQATLGVVLTGGQRCAILTGVNGIGKTRLLEEFHRWATQQEINSAMTQCYSSNDPMAYAPLTSWLRAFPLPPIETIWLSEIARLLPEILAKRPTLPNPQPITQDWQRQRMFEALAYTLLVYQPILLLMDDMQWCDSGTLEWLQFLLQFNPNARLLVLGAFRLGEELSNSTWPNSCNRCAVMVN
jgi:predicted ATPase